MNQRSRQVAMTVTIAFTTIMLYQATQASAVTTRRFDAGAGNDNWTSVNNWTNNNQPHGFGEAAVFGSGSKNNPPGPNVILNSSRNVGSLRFNNSKQNEGSAIRSRGNFNNTTGANNRTITIRGDDQTGAFAISVNNNKNPAVTHTIQEGARINNDGVASNGFSLEWRINGNKTLNVKSRVSGDADLVKTGTGTLRFSQTQDHNRNTYVGDTFVNAGLLELEKKADSTTIRGDLTINGTGIARLDRDHQIADTSTVTINDSGTFNIVDENETIKRLILTSGTVTGTTGVLTSTDDIDARSGTISAILDGSSGLNKTTAGTVTLSKANTYSGDTTVSDGTLALTGAGSIASSSLVTVVSGATLDVSGVGGGFSLASGQTIAGTGNVVGIMTLGTGSVISPGASPGTMSTGSQIWTDGASELFEIDDASPGSAGSDPGWDLIDITGSLDLTGLTAGGFEIDVVSLLHPGHGSGDAANFDPSEGYAWEFVRTTQGINGFEESDFTLDISGFTNDFGRGGFSVRQSGDSLFLVFSPPAPEPSSIILSAMSLVGLACGRRRRSRSC